MRFFFQAAFLNALLLLINVGCSTVNSSMSNISRETPYPALTSITETLKCMGGVINESEAKTILLLVDDFFDGTVPVVTDAQVLHLRRIRENGPLADAGKYDFEAVIKRSIANDKIILPYTTPSGLLQEDIYGRVSAKYLKDLAESYGAAAIIRIKGVFTQNDASDYENKGFGSGAGTEGKHGEAEIEYGVSSASRSISLAIHLGDPFKNIIGAATTLTLNTYTQSDKFSVGFGYGEGYLSFARQSRLREGVHGAQRTLVEAAAMWTLRGIYNQLDFSHCIDPEGISPSATIAAREKWKKLDEHERILYLKLMLRELEYYTGAIDKQYDVALQQAILAYEEKNSILIPHTKDSLSNLFILLYLQIGGSTLDTLVQQTNRFI
jgi:hypothetical protein